MENKNGSEFTNIDNIFSPLLQNGVYLREVTLPTDNPNFKMIANQEKTIWRANMIVLGKEYQLTDVDTFKYLIKCGANIRACNDFAIYWCVSGGHTDLVKYLVKKGAKIHVFDDCPLRLASEKGYLDIVKLIIKKEKSKYVSRALNLVLRWGAISGHLNIVKYTTGLGADIHIDNDFVFRWSAKNGHLDVVKYLIELGANIHVNDDFAFKWSEENGHLDVHKFLKTCLDSKETDNVDPKC